MSTWVSIGLIFAAGDYETVVRDSSGVQQRLDSKTPGFATAIELDAEAAGLPGDSRWELLARTPGVSAMSIGGLGQFSALSVRGAGPQQTALFVDGVPLGGGLAGLFSLADLPLEALDRVEIYRGYVPILFGGAAIGGAVNLTSTRGPPRSSLAAGMGSFGARELRGSFAEDTGPIAVAGRLGFSGATGDFPYHDEGTPLERRDDRTLVRTNNGYDRLLSALRLSGRAGDGRLWAQLIGFDKRQGIAGPSGAPTRRTRLETTDARLVLGAELLGLAGPGGRGAVVLGAGWQGRDFRDPLNELGEPLDDNRSSAQDLFVSPRMRLPLWSGGFLGGVLEGRWEHVAIDTLAAPRGPEQPSGDSLRRRASAAVGLEIEQHAFSERLLVVPAVRLDGARSSFRVPPGAGEVEDSGRDAAAVETSPRLGARLAAADGLELRGSVGRYFRPPSLLELFGKSGWIVGNEGLRPERGVAADFGIVIDAAPVYAQIAGFWIESQRLIQWFPVGPAVRPENVSGARQAGVEAGASTEIDRLRAYATYTWMRARAGQRTLPGRPEHDVAARVSWASELFGIGGKLMYSFEYISGTYLDANGRRGVPPRALHGAGVELARGPLALSAHVQNLFDLRTSTWRPPVANAPEMVVPASDYIGYPLPGRSLWISLSIDVRQVGDPS